MCAPPRPVPARSWTPRVRIWPPPPSALRKISENLATTTANLDRLMTDHREDLGLFLRDSLPEMERLVRDSRQAAQEFRELSRSLKADPSQLLYEPSYRGVEIPR